MVQFFRGSADPRDAAWGQLADSLGMGLGQGLNTYYANKAIDSVLEDPELKDAPLSERWKAMNQRTSMYGENGRRILQERLQAEQYGEQEKEAKLAKQEALQKEERLFAHQKELQTQKDAAALERSKNKAPLGGLGGQPVPQDQIDKIDKFLQENPNATANQIAVGLGKLGVNPAYSKEYVDNARENEKTLAKTGTEHQKALRSETLPLRTEIAKKGLAAKHGIQNKKQLLDIIENGDINDPTYAALAEALPLNLGKRMLSEDTVRYKAGLVEEFGDLKNLFAGATRVKELDILQEKIADTYLTDAQKKAILNSRIKALQSDVILADAAAELEEEGKNYPISTYNKKLQEKAQPKLDALFNRILDEQKFIIQDAENKKKMPLDFSNPEDKEIIQQIYKEAGGDVKKAEALAKKKGYHW
jgi:hypothetical protein